MKPPPRGSGPRPSSRPPGTPPPSPCPPGPCGGAWSCSWPWPRRWGSCSACAGEKSAGQSSSPPTPRPAWAPWRSWKMPSPHRRGPEPPVLQPDLLPPGPGGDRPPPGVRPGQGGPAPGGPDSPGGRRRLRHPGPQGGGPAGPQAGRHPPGSRPVGRGCPREAPRLRRGPALPGRRGGGVPPGRRVQRLRPHLFHAGQCARRACREGEGLRTCATGQCAACRERWALLEDFTQAIAQRRSSSTSSFSPT